MKKPKTPRKYIKTKVDVPTQPDTSNDSEMIGIFKAEQLKADSSLYEGYSQAPYNPDIIVQKKGDFSTYDKMRRDDQAKAVLWLKKFMILSNGWDIKSNEDTEEDQSEPIKGIKCNLSTLSKPDFGDALTNMLTHIDYGFSITEPVFSVFNNLIILKKLKTRAPHTFLLETDDYGDLSIIRQYTAGADVELKPKDIDKLIYLVHQQEFGVPYGVSDLQGCYRAWFSKDIIIRFWNMYLERFGNPHFVATIPKNLSDPEKARLKTIFKTLQSSTGIQIPEGVSLELVFPAAGKTGFEAAIDKYNMMISRSMLIPDLIGIGGKEIAGGSFALGQKHFDIFFMTITKHRNDLELAVNRRIIHPLAKWNYGILPDQAPRFKLNPLDDANKQEYLKLWTEAVKGKIWVATDEEIDHFREQTKFPTGGKVERPKEPPKFPGAQFDEPNPTEPGKLNPIEKEELNPVELTQKKRPLTTYEEKVDFVKIEKETDDLDEEGNESLSTDFKLIMESFLANAKPVIKSRDIERIRKLKLKNLPKLRISIRIMLAVAFKEGMASAKSELPTRQMALAESTAELFSEALTERSYFITGVVDDTIKRDAFLIMANHIDKGFSVPETMFVLRSYFEDNYVKFGARRLETIVRTNNTKAYNFGRRKIFEDPDLDEFVEAYQFSAILDDRTTDICNKLDERIYKINDPYIDKVTPPLHYNCRSLLVPVTQDEEYKVSTKLNLEKFGGIQKGIFV